MSALTWSAVILLFVIFPNPSAAQDNFSPPIKKELARSQKVPDWVIKTPGGCFVGISRPCRTIEEARQQAFDSAISQILLAMGAEYRLTHKSSLSGSLSNSKHELKEQLIYKTQWFINSVHQNVEHSTIEKVGDRYAYFILVRFPPKEIERLRRLTIGSKITAMILDEEKDHLTLNVRETNGVRVTLTDYHITVTTKNHYAGIITMFAWKVPESSNRDSEGVIDQKISINGNSKRFTIPNPNRESTLSHLILGSRKQMSIILQGYDELGRTVSVQVMNP